MTMFTSILENDRFQLLSGQVAGNNRSSFACDTDFHNQSTPNVVGLLTHHFLGKWHDYGTQGW
jgi:hypothetical protein